MKTLDIIALSGKAGSGKDFAFEKIFAPIGYHRWALADHFKIWIVGRKLATYEEVFQTKPPHVRAALQKAGTEEGRDVHGTEIWLDTSFAWLEHLSNTMNITKWVITDCRFPNECDYVRARGGLVFRIEAPKRVEKSSLSPAQRQHISETALDTYTQFDAVIDNDLDTLRPLHWLFEKAFDKLQRSDVADRIASHHGYGLVR